MRFIIPQISLYVRRIAEKKSLFSFTLPLFHSTNKSRQNNNIVGGKRKKGEKIIWATLSFPHQNCTEGKKRVNFCEYEHRGNFKHQDGSLVYESNAERSIRLVVVVFLVVFLVVATIYCYRREREREL